MATANSTHAPKRLPEPIDLDQLAQELIEAIAVLRDAQDQLAEARSKLPPANRWRAA